MSFHNTGLQPEVESAENTIYRSDRLKEFIKESTTDLNEEKVKEIIDRYFDPSSNFRLFFVTIRYRMYGLIGIELKTPFDAHIHHICVDADLRWRGLGKLMLEEIATCLKLRMITAFADEISAGFFESCGFELEKIFEHSIENDQFRCTKLIVPL